MHRFACLPVFAACVVAACGGKVDESNTGSGNSRAIGAPGDPAPSAPSAPRPACAIQTPLREGFEAGLPAGWVAANPGGLRLLQERPLRGTTSLVVNTAAQPPRAFFASSPLDFCAATLRIAIRAEAALLLPDAKTTIARLIVPPSALAVVVGDGGIALVETSLATQDSSGVAHPIGTLGAESPAEIVVTFDLTTGSATGSVSPLEGPAAAATSLRLEGTKGTAAAFMLGLWATTSSAGRVWIDDVALE